MLDRIDMHVEVPNMSRELLRARTDPGAETSAMVRQRVAHAIQLQRAGKSNSKLNNRELEQYCRLDKSLRRLLEQAIDQLGLSARAIHRIIKVARTIADLDNQYEIQSTHLAEAISYRRLERMGKNV